MPGADMERGSIRAQERQSLRGESSDWVKTATTEVRMGFIRKVYSILTIQLILTVCIAAPFQQMSPMWLQTHAWLMGLSMIITLSTICAMSCCRDTVRHYPTNYIVLFIFTGFEGVLIGFISAQYTAGSVAICAAITAAIFLGMTIFAWTTKTDFTGYGPYLWGALISLFVFGMAMSILRMCGVYIPGMMMLYDLMGVLIFVMYIVFDTQLIIGENGGHKNQFSIDDYVFAALNLYLDIINLFIHLLALLGKRR